MKEYKRMQCSRFFDADEWVGGTCPPHPLLFLSAFGPPPAEISYCSKAAKAENYEFSRFCHFVRRNDTKSGSEYVRYTFLVISVT